MTRKPKPSDDAETNRRELLSSVSDDVSKTNARRRSVLRGAAATALATVGLTNAAAAIDPSDEAELQAVKQKYSTETEMRATVETHGRDLFDLLADHGYVSDAEMDELDNWYVAAWKVDGTATARIDSLQEYGDGQLRVSIEPETGRRYAVDSSGDQWTILDPDADQTVKQRDASTATTSCLDSFDCYECAETEVVCEDGGCHIGPGGSCCSSCDIGCGCY
ncbi:hypothetical protein [Halorussus caseinilyticus]|uniref:Twin-arginine translocation signal domain-containing protein n=1 Tax=Halorussus caseinilyticus TaxID=3034025 RepID=A0ABD5WK20_9EURY|nr:hypothetical protein [Halorussus sp. DT72]